MKERRKLGKLLSLGIIILLLASTLSAFISISQAEEIIQDQKPALMEIIIPRGSLHNNTVWRYVYDVKPKGSWESDIGFDDAGWSVGRTPIGSGDFFVRTNLYFKDLYVRKMFRVEKKPFNAILRIAFDGGAEVWVNGLMVFTDIEGLHYPTYWNYVLNITDYLKTGDNLLAVHVWNKDGGYCCFDAELVFLEGTLQESVFTFVKSRQNPDGGFSEDHMDATFYATSILNVFGKIDAIDRDKTAFWIMSHKFHDGYFGNWIWWQYQAVESLKNLRRPLDSESLERLVNILIRWRSQDGSWDSSIGGTWISIEGLASMNSLGKIRDWDKTIDFIKSLQAQDGGFKNTHKDSESYMRFTFYALRCLHLLNATDRIDRNKVLTFIMSCYKDDAFSDRLGWGPWISPTYWAVKSLETLNSLNNIDPERVANRILSWQSPQGVFGGLEIDYYAVMILQTLGKLYKLDKDKFLRYLLEHYYNPDGGFKWESNIYSTEHAIRILSNTNMLGKMSKEKVINYVLSLPFYQWTTGEIHSAVYCLNTLGASNKIDKQRVVREILNHQNPDGGFGSREKEESNLWETYLAVDSLHIINMLDSIEKEKIVAYILSLRNPDGSFNYSKRERVYSVRTTALAVITLGLLGEIGRIEERTVNFILNSKRDDGSFGDILDTYLSLKALKLLNRLQSSDLEDSVNYALSLQNLDGGFGWWRGDAWSWLDSTDYAVSILRLLESRGSQAFKVVTVTLQVLDYDGAPLEEAWVRSFSEDYGLQVPNFGLNRTNSRGILTLRLMNGTWSFFIYGGEKYASKKPGYGYFMCLLNYSLQSDATLVLQPNVTTMIYFVDLYGAPLNGKVNAIELNHAPIVLTTVIGATKDGKITIYSPQGISMKIFMQSLGASIGYTFLETVPSGGSLTIRATVDKMAKLNLNCRDKNNNPSVGTFFINYNEFDIGDNTGLHPIEVVVSGHYILYSTPTMVTITSTLQRGWGVYHSVPEDYFLASGSELTLNIGGPMNVSVHVMQDRTQIWLYVRDSYGNLWMNSWPISIPIRIRKGSETIYSTNLRGFVDYLDRTYQPTDSLEYNIILDLREYGVHNLVGSLLDPQTLLRFRNITTNHLIISVPDVGGKVEERFNKIVSFFEKAYIAESEAIGRKLTNKVRVEFPIDIIAGVAGTDYVGMAIGFSLDMSYKTIPSTFIGVATHELGHVFQLSPPFQPNGWFITSWHGEPAATWLGNMAIESVLSPRLALFDRGRHDNFYLDLLRGAPTQDRLIENVQFLMFYMQRWFGKKVLRDFAELWSLRGIGSLLAGQGFSVDESIVSVYSAIVKRNLAPHFRIAGLDVKDDRIKLGMQTVAQLISEFNNQSKAPSLTLFKPEVNGLKVSVNGVTLPGAADRSIVRIRWDWGDGYSEDHWFPASHTYSEPGNYIITVTSYQNDGLSTTSMVTVTISQPPDFSILISSPSLPIVIGSSGSLEIKVNSMHGFSGLVSLSVSGLPSGVSASFNPSSTYIVSNHLSNSTLTLNVSSTASTGTYTIIITGTSGSLSHSASIILTIVESPSTGLTDHTLLIILLIIVIILALGTASLIVLRGRKKETVDPEIMRKIKELSIYLDRLEELHKKGEVSGNVYERLREEYMSKIKELEDKLRKLRKPK